MNISDLSRFPVNTRGYTVIPVIQLIQENMNESLVGLRVTIGLDDQDYGTTDQGTIVGYDDDKVHVKVGSKVKKYSYDPDHVQLQVYQFEMKVLFSNEVVSEKELASSHKNHYNDDSDREKQPTIQPTEEKKDNVDDIELEKKVETKPKRKKSSSYKPKNTSIEWS